MKAIFDRHSARLQAGISGDVLDVPRTALLIVDMTRMGLYSYSAEESQAMIDKIDAFQDRTGIRAIYCDTTWDEEPTVAGKPQIQKRSVWGAPDRPQSIQVAKKMQSAFQYDAIGNIKIPSDLKGFLERENITDIMVCGVEGPLCTWDTAVDGPLNGYKTHFLKDLTFTSAPVRRGQRYFDITPELAAQHNVNLVNSTDFTPVAAEASAEQRVALAVSEQHLR